MHVEVLGVITMHESEGFGALRLPLFGRDEQRPLDEFFGDARVVAALARHSIGFQPPIARPAVVAEPTETTYANNCSYAPNPNCGVTSCSEGMADLWDSELCGPNPYGTVQYACCGALGRVAFRTCGMGGSNYCGAEGSGGCATCWSSPTSSCNAWWQVESLPCTNYGTVYGYQNVERALASY
jgi:hypothetical protein